MIFRAVAVTAVLVIASIGPAASSTCDLRIANLCPGAPITESAASAPVVAASTTTASPLKITSTKRAQRKAKRHSRSKHYARHRRGKSTRISSARKRSHVASRSERKRHERHAKIDEMVGLANQALEEGDKPLGDGPALGGGVPADAVAGAVRASDAPANSPTPKGALSAFASIGANTLPSRAFQPVASNTPSSIVTARNVNAPTMAPVRVASADVAPTPAVTAAAAAAPKPQPQKPAPQQVMQASTIGGIEITSLRAMFLVFGALLLAGTAVRLAIG